MQLNPVKMMTKLTQKERNAILLELQLRKCRANGR